MELRNSTCETFKILVKFGRRLFSVMTMLPNLEPRDASKTNRREGNGERRCDYNKTTKTCTLPRENLCANASYVHAVVYEILGTI
jgi:hypothetical protein